MNSPTAKTKIAAAVFFALGILFLLNENLSITLGLWAVTGGIYVWENNQASKALRARKLDFISGFPPDDLCVANQNPNLVYIIRDRKENELEVQVIWAGQKPVEQGKILNVPSDAVREFNANAFLGL